MNSRWRQKKKLSKINDWAGTIPECTYLCTRLGLTRLGQVGAGLVLSCLVIWQKRKLKSLHNINIIAFPSGLLPIYTHPTRNWT